MKGCRREDCKYYKNIYSDIFGDCPICEAPVKPENINELMDYEGLCNVYKEKEEIINTAKEILDTNNCCCLCLRQQNIDGKAWIYCNIFNNKMLTHSEFDETGERDGCSYFDDDND